MYSTPQKNVNDHLRNKLNILQDHKMQMQI
jgi:hypothetical protein